MPELPEVETVAVDLREAILGRRIVGVTIRDPRLRRPLSLDFSERVCGRTITHVGRRGKYLFLNLGDGSELVVHLGMSGTMRVERGTQSHGHRHAHVVFAMEGGGCLVYNDPRRFGFLEVRPENDEGFVTVGVDPLGGDFTMEFLKGLCRRRRRPIKNLLMDQGLIGGLGNIYANEILFRAGVRPGRAAGRLTRNQCGAIVAATGNVLREAIRRRGSSISDFRDATGTPGEFQRSFRVYGRQGEPCRECGTPIQRQVLAGRASFYCRRCQR